MLMVVIMLPFIFFALYEKDGQPAEKILGHVIKSMFLRDKAVSYTHLDVYKRQGIDYALKKDTSEQPPRYLVFFKGRDVDVMTQAFKEFSAKTVKQKEKQSLKQKLSRSREQSKAQHKEKVKVKTKDRGVEL